LDEEGAKVGRIARIAKIVIIAGIAIIEKGSPLMALRTRMTLITWMGSENAGDFFQATNR
jgi:hypothetical protein